MLFFGPFCGGQAAKPPQASEAKRLRGWSRAAEGGRPKPAGLRGRASLRAAQWPDPRPQAAGAAPKPPILE